MKVLMITPRVDPDHDIFGFIHGWVDKLSEKVDKLYVITFGVGKIRLGSNVEVYSADSKTQAGKLIILNTLLLKLTPKVDVVFTHMYPWLPIAAAPYAKVFRKPLVMWNAHGHVDLKKRLALTLVDKVVTASERSFNIDTPKKIVIGHGIDTDKFRPSDQVPESADIVSVGRIGRVKRYHILIDAFDIVINEKRLDLKLKVAGPIYDEKYYEELKGMVEKSDLASNVEFTGSLSFNEIDKVYKESGLYVSASTTESIDKTMLEAMACELPIVVCNEAFLDIFDEEMKEKCYFKKGNHRELAEKIEYFMKNDEKKLRKRLRRVVGADHSLNRLAEKLVEVFGGEYV